MRVQSYTELHSYDEKAYILQDAITLIPNPLLNRRLVSLLQCQL